MSDADSNTQKANELCAKDAKHVLRPWSGGTPVPIVKARGCTVVDASGQEFLDFTSGFFVNQAGHCHPRVIEAVKRQLDKVMQVSGKQSTEASIALAELMVEISPDSIEKVFFSTGGSEAVEFALKMARQHKRKKDIAYLENAFHGLTLGALALCGSEKYRNSAGVSLGDNTYPVPTPYCYRCKFQNDCATQCLDEAEKRLDERPDTAAFVAEPIQSVGGIIPPEKWWERADAIRRKRGLLLVLDEIQTGVGRTGKMFAAEHYGLQPDVMTVGKGMSGGVGALSMALSSAEVAEGFFTGTTPTNGGNAVSAAAGRALIETLIDEKIIENCAAMGRYFTAAVADLDDPWVGDIRFKGLMGGVELVEDRDSRAVLPKELVGSVHRGLHQEGMLLTVSGMHGNVLRLQPPLTITSTQIDTFVAALRRVLNAVRAAR